MLHITTLGGLSISVDGQSIPRSVTSKALALLCYLAVTARPHTREMLLALLWSEMDETEAQNNLRQALFQLRKYAEPYLSVTRSEVAFDLQQPHRLDVTVLESAARDPRAPIDAALLSGEFLQGFSVKNAPEFENWVAGQRARFGETAAQILLQQANTRATAADVPGALDAFNQLLARDPWREEAHRQKMLLLARAGQYSAALAQFEACKTNLQQELGVPPAAETRRLAERIARALDRPALALPREAAAFVGRTTERAALAGLLAQDQVRLITLLGPGGIGKTRLALEMAQVAQRDYLEGVAWVGLQAVTDVAQVLPAIIGALGLPSARMPLNTLIDYLRDKQLLLVLDNMEHVLDSADDLSKLLEAAPELRILATSRERLNLRWENVFALEGLSYASVGVDATVAEPARSVSEAAQLFVDRSKRVQHQFVPSASDAQAIDQICALLGGMPLAIELACGMLSTRPVDTIALTLAQDLGAVSTTLRDAPARQRSLRAVFDQSWSALSAAERAVASRLAVCRGSFTLEAALAVGQTTDAMVRRLTDNSMLHAQDMAGSTRYSMHEVLRVFAQEALDRTGEASAARDLHLAFYAGAVAASFVSMTGPRQAQVLAALQSDDANMASAWQWAIDRQRHDALQTMTPPIYRYATIVSSLAQWLPRFERALSALPGTPPQPVRAMLQARLGGALNAVGEFERARELLLHAVAALAAPEHGVECAYARLLLGNGWLAQGKLAEAEAAFIQAIESPDSYAAGAALANLALVDQRQGRYEQAVARYQARLRQAQFDGDIRNQAISRLNEATLHYALSRFEETEAALREAEALWAQTNDQIGRAMTLGNLGELMLERNQPDEAERYLRRALPVFREVGQRHMICSTLGSLGKLAFLRNQLSEARAYLNDSLALATAIGANDQLAMHQQTLADVLVAQGDVAAGRTANIAALRAAATGGEQRYQFECLLRLAEIDASTGASALPGRILATLLAQETLPSDLRSRAEALTRSTAPAAIGESLERLIAACTAA